MIASLTDYLIPSRTPDEALRIAVEDLRDMGGGILVIPPVRLPVLSSFTIPDTITVCLVNGGRFDPEQDVTLTIEGPVLAFESDISGGAGTVTLNGPKLQFASTGSVEFLPKSTETITVKRVKSVMRKVAIENVAPSPTANTFGAAVDINPSTGYYGFDSLVHVALTSGGTFGTEVLTVRITAVYEDGTTASVERAFTTSGTQSNLTNADLYDLMADGKSITKLQVDARSNIANSTATGGAKVAAINT